MVHASQVCCLLLMEVADQQRIALAQAVHHGITNAAHQADTGEYNLLYG